MDQNSASHVDWLELWGILSYFGRTFEHRSEEILQEEGLSHVQLRLLHQSIHHQQPLSLSELGRRLGSSHSNVTQLLDRMEKEGLVRRDPVPDDRRRLQVTVTDQGIQRFERCLLALSRAEQHILGEIEPRERDQIAYLLNKLLSQSPRSRDALMRWRLITEDTFKKMRLPNKKASVTLASSPHRDEP